MEPRLVARRPLDRLCHLPDHEDALRSPDPERALDGRRRNGRDAMPILQPLGRAFLVFLAAAGRLTLFAVNAVSHCLRPPLYPRLIFRQMVEIGYYSLPVVGLTAIFTGMA